MTTPQADRTMMIVAPDSPPTEASQWGACGICENTIWPGVAIRRRFYWGGRTVIIHAACDSTKTTRRTT